MKRLSTQDLVILSILGALSLLVRTIEFPILPAAPFLKIDFSDLVALVGMLIKGPVGFFLVGFIRDLLNFILKGGQAGIPIGAIMSLLATVAMLLPTHWVLAYAKSWSKAMQSVVIVVSSTLLLTLALALLNYFVTLPIYITVMNFPIDDILSYVMAVVVPFNLIKGVIIGIGQLITIKVFKPLLAKRDRYYYKYS
ncbi:ECF transporter S component [Hutsoniella sourekii]|uniref:ECF transporter S component n=1 Tax=Hutsoniella sourekii TaxID=87650 RepID=UPI0004B98DDB|nr:ECF transporter S component [Hutsoniella sourekii]